MQNFTTTTRLGFILVIGHFDSFWTKWDLFEFNGLHPNRKGTGKLIFNSINFIVLPFTDGFPSTLPSILALYFIALSLTMGALLVLVLSPSLIHSFLLGSLKGSMQYQYLLTVHTETNSSQLILPIPAVESAQFSLLNVRSLANKSFI